MTRVVPGDLAPLKTFEDHLFTGMALSEVSEFADRNCWIGLNFRRELSPRPFSLPLRFRILLEMKRPGRICRRLTSLPDHVLKFRNLTSDFVRLGRSCIVFEIHGFKDFLSLRLEGAMIALKSGFIHVRPEQICVYGFFNAARTVPGLKGRTF